MDVLKKIAKKCVLGLLILSIEMPCSACFFRSADYVASYDGGKISAEVYKNLQQGVLGPVIRKIAKRDPGLVGRFSAAVQSGCVGEAFGLRVDGKTVESMVAAATKDEAYRFVAVGAFFDMLKLKLPKETLKQVDQMKKQLVDAEKAEAKMKKKQTAREVQRAADERKRWAAQIACVENDAKRDVVFDYYYGDKGKEKPSNKDLRKYFDSNYIKFRCYLFQYTAGGDEEKGVVQKQAEKFLEDAKTLGFEKAVVKEYDSRVAKSGQKSEGKETDEEKVKMVSPVQFASKEELRMDPSLEVIKNTPLNKVASLDVGMAIVVFERMGLTGADFKQRKNGLLHAVKGDEFEERLLKHGKTLGFKFNGKALVECRPSNIDLGGGD
ncbi:MAG: hypothetical protein LBB04_02920 [Oscillospiraceae bacterium]|jgi:hypothetical protein|nr:hypothetical protein [Oscillospiraceae bacterium]